MNADKRGIRRYVLESPKGEPRFGVQRNAKGQYETVRVSAGGSCEVLACFPGAKNAADFAQSLRGMEALDRALPEGEEDRERKRL